MQVTTRDILMIMWINSFGCVTLEQIAAWMGVDISTARRRVRLLIKGKLLRRLEVPLLPFEPIVPTTAGCRLANDPLAPLSGFRIGTWNHDSFLVTIERGLENHFGGWLEPERRIRADRRFAGAQAMHTPDAIIHRPGGRLVAIELELSAKAPKRLQSIIDQYAASGTFEHVAYVTDNEKLGRFIQRFTKGFDFIDVTIYRPTPQRTPRPFTSARIRSPQI